MKTETILGLGALIVLIAFLAFTLRQGMGVKRKPGGVPPEETSGGTFN